MFCTPIFNVTTELGQLVHDPWGGERKEKSNHTWIYRYYSRSYLSELQSHTHHFWLFLPVGSWLWLFKWPIVSVSGLALPVVWQLKTLNNCTSKVGFTTKVKVTVNLRCCCVHCSTCYVHSAQKINFRLSNHRTLVTASSQLLSSSTAACSHIHLCHVG